MSGPEQPDADDLARALAALEAGVEVELDGVRLRPRRGPDAWRRAVALLKLGRRHVFASMLRDDDGIPRHVRLLLADLLTKPGKGGRRPLVAWNRVVALLKLGQRDAIASMLRGDDGIPRHVRLLLADLVTEPGNGGRRPLVVDGIMVDEREVARLLKVEKRLSEERAAGRRGPGQGPQVTVAGEVGMSERTVRRRMRGK